MDTEYLRAAEQVIDLAQSLIISLDDVPIYRIDVLAERPLGQLIRATNNVAAVAYKGVAEYTGADYDDIEEIRRALEPYEHGELFNILPQAGEAFTGDVIHGIWWGIQDWTSTTYEGKLQTADAVVPGHVSNELLPAAFVINGAMPVIVKLMKKVNALNNNERLEAGTDRIRRRHRSAIGIPN